MRYITIFLLITMAKASAQSYDKIVKTNIDKVTVNQADHVATACIKPVKARLRPDADKFYYWYSGGNIHITQGGFSGKLLNGRYTDYYLNKNLRAQGEFKKGLKQGVWKNWYEDGHLKEQMTWKSGRKSGPFSRYDSSGKIVEKGRYRTDLLQGKITTYHAKDSTTIVHYRRGKVYIPKKIKVPNPMKKLLKAGSEKKKDRGIQKQGD